MVKIPGGDVQIDEKSLVEVEQEGIADASSADMRV